MNQSNLTAAPRTRVWDLPTRLFHWTLAALIVFSFVTIKLGGNWVDWHMRSGYAILALILFRLLWGFAGSRYALFSSFVRGPGAVFGYLSRRVRHLAGHNPLGALSVLALLAAVLVQATTGLFTNDGSFTEGPLAKLVSSAVSDRLSTIHRWGETLLYVLVGLHVAAILFYTFVKRERIVPPMLSGDAPVDAPPAQDDAPLRLRAALLFALCALLAWYIVTL